VTLEANFDGLVGPTHNYAGLASGNVASHANRGAEANPREAALQGLAKMDALRGLGLTQGVLPPHERPHMRALRALGFAGTDTQVLERAARRAPHLLAACSSAAGMWVANAATVVPGADTDDGRVHFVPANLAHALHRSLEAPTTARMLRAVFADPARFMHHDPLPATATLADEGAANHTRLTNDPDGAGTHLFVYGRIAMDDGAPQPRRFPARQTLEASAAVARLAGLPDTRVVFAQQSPEAIDAGVFHNDVICVGTDNTLLVHERAFLDQAGVLKALSAAVGSLQVIEVTEVQLPLADAVRSYLFNSQLVRAPGGALVLVCPGESRENPATAALLDAWTSDSACPIDRFVAVETRQSMRNGGGPACLRLRVTLTGDELGSVAPGVLLDDVLLGRLNDWVARHYRDRLGPADLADPQLLAESRAALDELTGLLGLGALYDFQR
jgi:succinylarginine dihydrolase